MAAFGATPQQIAEALQPICTDYAVWPENWDVIQWYMEVADLTRYAPNGAYLGLDLQQVEVEARLSQRQVSTTLFSQLRAFAQMVVKEIRDK